MSLGSAVNKCFVNGLGFVSTQNTLNSEFLQNPIDHSKLNVLPIFKPNYKEYIPPAAVRRMSSGVKNSIVASKLAMKEAELELPDAIITGTGMGCMQDSEKFLKPLINNDEEYLTPTSFIQSTHNTVGGQIALGLQCNAYNFTYVNAAASFESALLDSLLQIQSKESNNILLGGIDELSEHTLTLNKLIHFIKDDEEAPFNLLKSKTKGTIYGQGAAFSVIQNEKKDATYCELVDVKIQNILSENQVQEYVESFLSENKLSFKDIDIIITGNNGDVEFDGYYNNLKKTFDDASQLYFKHLFGEYMTASSAAFWIASNIFKTGVIPNALKLNKKKPDKMDHILIYNQYRGKDHCLTLLRNV